MLSNIEAELKKSIAYKKERVYAESGETKTEYNKNLTCSEAPVQVLKSCQENSQFFVSPAELKHVTAR